MVPARQLNPPPTLARTALSSRDVGSFFVREQHFGGDHVVSLIKVLRRATAFSPRCDARDRSLVAGGTPRGKPERLAEFVAGAKAAAKIGKEQNALLRPSRTSSAAFGEKQAKKRFCGLLSPRTGR
jgi:hypothetical protein